MAAAVRAHRSRGGTGEGVAGRGEQRALGVVVGGGTAAGVAAQQVRVEPGVVTRIETLVDPQRGELAGAGVVRHAGGAHAPALRSMSAASAAARASRSTARAWRRLSRARVRSARAATWDTPSAAASSRPVRSWSSARSSAVRWRSGMRSRARCRSPESRRVHHEVLGRRRRVARLADERHEPDDLVAAEVVERDPVGDLVQPRAGVLGLLERVVGAVGLHERVLGQVRGELGVPEHAQQVRVDLVLVLREQLLDEAVGLVAIPAGAHGEARWTVVLFELDGIRDHVCSAGDRCVPPIRSFVLQAAETRPACMV